MCHALVQLGADTGAVQPNPVGLHPRLSQGVTPSEHPTPEPFGGKPSPLQMAQDNLDRAVSPEEKELAKVGSGPGLGHMHRTIWPCPQPDIFLHGTGGARSVTPSGAGPARGQHVCLRHCRRGAEPATAASLGAD